MKPTSWTDFVLPDEPAPTSSRDTPSEASVLRCRAVGQVCACAIIGIGLVVVLAEVWEFLAPHSALRNLRDFLAGEFWAGEVKMALTTALAFISSGIALLAHLKGPAWPRGWLVSRAGAVLVLSWAFYVW